VMDLVGNARGDDETGRCGEEEMQPEESEEEFQVCAVRNDDVIQDQGKEKDGHPDERDQYGLPKLFQSRLAEDLPVCADKDINKKPEYGYQRDPEVQVGVGKNGLGAGEHLRVNSPFTETEKEEPGGDGRNVIRNDVSDDLFPLVHSLYLLFRQVPGQDLDVIQPDLGIYNPCGLYRIEKDAEIHHAGL
jgi:hypothetical protein